MIALLLVAAAAADEPFEVTAARPAPGDIVQPAPDPPDDGFSFLGLVQGRYTLSNVVPTSAYLNGQVVGELGGTNLTEVSAEERSRFGEYRTVGFFRYAPPVLDGRAELAAGFEIDFVPGDQSYAVSGNTGGAYGGDMVNLQTRRLNATFRPDLGGGHRLEIVTGLQFVADGASNPAAAAPDDLFRAGGGLRFWGSEAAGVSVYGRCGDGWGERLRYRAGAYTLYEQGVGLTDDVTLLMADAQLTPAYATQLGLHGWVLRDNGDGGGGAFGAGPTSPLAELQGAARLDFRPGGEGEAPAVDADLIWLLADAGYNRGLAQGPLGLGVFGAVNAGKIYVTDQIDPDVLGFAAGGELRWRYAPGSGSVLRLEALATSPNGPESDVYSGVITGNSYGIVGALWATHGAVLLFPDIQAINRQVAVVYDISNQGDGLVAAVGGAGYDLVPEKLTLTANGAWASTPAGQAMGTELNAGLVAHPWLLFDIGLVGATVSGSPLPEDPWAVFTFLQWVVF